MSQNWVRYRTSENTTELYNLDQASLFRHVYRGDESVLEFQIGDTTYTIMYSIDPDAYHAAIKYILTRTGIELT